VKIAQGKQKGDVTDKLKISGEEKETEDYVKVLVIGVIFSAFGIMAVKAL
jgi:hypothetical protein